MRTRFTHRRQTKNSNYRGVTKKSNKEWFAYCTHKNVVHKKGPFKTERNAARAYDNMALEFQGSKALLNLSTNPLKELELLEKEKEKEKKAEEREIKKQERLKEKEKEEEVKEEKRVLRRKRKAERMERETKKRKIIEDKKYVRQTFKRVQFPQATRNKICSRQKWCCNFCGDLFADVFVVDHMVPLCLGGNNEEYNLQALCASCDKFKTGYLDFKVLLPIVKENPEGLTPDIVKQVQRENFHKMMCIPKREAEELLDFKEYQKKNPRENPVFKNITNDNIFKNLPQQNGNQSTPQLFNQGLLDQPVEFEIGGIKVRICNS